MKTTTLYPRGYIAGDDGAATVVVSSGDLVADALFDSYAKTKGRPITMGLYDKVFEYALLQFGDFDAWLDMQLSNPLIVGPYREYLIDTMNFIGGSARLMHQSSWQFVLKPMDIKNSDVRIVRHLESRKYLTRGTTTTQILQKWCSRPEGFNDLVNTLHVLFGHVGRTPA